LHVEDGEPPGRIAVGVQRQDGTSSASERLLGRYDVRRIWVRQAGDISRRPASAPG